MNENDTISVTELMFTDNDELSGLIATMMDVDMLIILSNVDGIYNGSPDDPSSEVIREIRSSQDDLSEYILPGKSSFGRGGMLTKCSIAGKVAEEGIPVVIANGKRDGILHEVTGPDSAVPFTLFVPSAKAASTVKKWIAHSEGFAKGSVVINDGAEAALREPKASSLLMVGVVDVHGDFEKDDIVEIVNTSGVRVGLGCVSYSAVQAKELIGKRDVRPLVHYDYLYTY